MSRPLPGGAAAKAGIGIGSEIDVTFFTNSQYLEGRFETPEGPEVTLAVVGIADSPFNMAAIPSDGDVYMGPAFREAYGEGLTSFSNLVVRLTDPERDVRRLEAFVAEKYPGRGVPVYDLHAAAKRVTNATDFERSGLLLFGLAVAVAGIVIVGQALTRLVRSAGTDVGTLIALGFSRRDTVRALLLTCTPVVATAVVVAVATSAALSPRFPIGLGRRVEVDPGVHIDLVVLATGRFVVAAAVISAVAVTAHRLARETSGGDDVDHTRSTIVQRLRRAGAPVPVTTGASFALEPGRGSRTLPTRPAIAGVIVGAVGVLGAITLAAGMGDAVRHPERFGAVWHAEAYFSGGGPPESALSMADVLSADDDVATASRFARIPLPIRDLVVPTYALDDVRGMLRFEVTEGRSPAGGREVVLGPDSASALGVRIGDRITIGALEEVEVVGLGLLPTTAHSSYDQGAWLTDDGLVDAVPASQYDSIRQEYASYGFTEEIDDREVVFLYGGLFLRFVDGVDKAKVIERMGGLLEGVVVSPAARPADQQNLDHVRHLPTLFSAFASLLAVAAIAHVSSSVVRRRRGDLAVLRALGCTPRQTRASVVWQATTLALVGLAVGVPVGVALGRVSWRAVAETTPMIYVAPLALTALVVAPAAAVAAANVLAAWPARVASRLRPAEVLRAE
ncbi:MAG TPA: FtsX-like permease family protein [Acidimicrobiales bacterium]|nr:FtsX-like permease family protein [Acidimicrobiales bacterium]